MTAIGGNMQQLGTAHPVEDEDPLEPLLQQRQRCQHNVVVEAKAHCAACQHGQDTVVAIGMRD